MMQHSRVDRTRGLCAVIAIVLIGSCGDSSPSVETDGDAKVDAQIVHPEPDAAVEPVTRL